MHWIQVDVSDETNQIRIINDEPRLESVLKEMPASIVASVEVSRVTSI